ncbi:dTMP kinase [Mycoplasmopsis canis]|uniref:dTMP kinase n=1 Tax=Mycoplasmopsis cynos TaxID=171284 RepID=UPI002AFF3A13|nr:dTMP kinase [Mycoplasmopsis cynos]WQQ13059.1 dTMP kinase [Mycoplasmopsis cynos]WQQ14161.1 dTMP kinase [Mycoplasmopsis cynos]
MFITLEGLDGSGKTTIMKEIAIRLKQKYSKLELIETREPGGKDLKEAERIREIILDNKSDLSPVAEAMLYSTSRRIHLEKIIWPALKENKLVLCDRYIDSFYAYQGFARGLGYKFVKNLTTLIIDGAIPDITIFLDATPSDSKKRRQESRLFEDRLENETYEFHEKVYSGYKQLINEDPKRFIIVNAMLSLNEVCDNIMEKLEQNQKFKNFVKEL